MNNLAHKPILLIEDDEAIRSVLHDFLEYFGFQVETASNGKEGLQKISQIRPALILLDAMMPVMDGWEFREQQLKNPDFANIPVVLLSAGQNFEKKALALGITKILTKPVTIEELIKVVKMFTG
jgi:CheY-like chemotaxis protein